MIRIAKEKDISKIGDLLSQVCLVHHKGRPDIFKEGRKYSSEELKELMTDKNRPILVCTDSNDEVMGYCFCIFQQHENDNVLTDIRTLYIDDLCVEENARGQHVGTALYRHVQDFARQSGCYNVTLNVWTCNEGAMKFYESLGMKPQKIGMEQIL